MINSILEFFPIIIIFLTGLSLLILIHELGHFLVAKKFGIKVLEFGLGFPPRAFAKKVGETLYSLNIIPLGGFVRLHGEEDNVKFEEKRAFYTQAKFVRATVCIAGVAANFVLAVLVFSIVSFLTVGIVSVEKVLSGSPAEIVGLQEGDVVLKVDGKEIYQADQLVYLVGTSGGREITLELMRNGEKLVKKTIPRETPPEGEGPLGVGLAFENYSGLERYRVSAVHGFNQTIFWAGMTFEGVRFIGLEITSGRAPEGVSGPVGILRVTGEVAKYGAIPLMNLLGIISINLAIINLLPIPALDGGRLLFIAVESIFGKRVLPTFERYAHTAGFVILITLILFVTFKDILGWASGQDIFTGPK